MQYKDLDTALNVLIEKAYLIAEQKGIRLPSKKIPRSEDTGYQSFSSSFGEAIRQQLNEKDLDTWFDEVITVFKRFGVQIAKFRVKIDSYDRSTDSDEPFPVFSRRIKELENIRDSPEYRNGYMSPSHRPIMTLKNNLLIQGANKYEPRDDDYKELISLLWKGRRIISPSGEELRKEKPTTRSMIEHKTKIDHKRLATISKGISIASKDNNMHVRIRYPQDVFLEISQSFK